MGFQPGYIYPLADPEHFDDEDFGTGFDHIAIPTEDQIPAGCYMVDGWPAKADGQIHPGYDSCPVPIRLEDVKIDEGRPLSTALPARQSPFAAFAR